MNKNLPQKAEIKRQARLAAVLGYYPAMKSAIEIAGSRFRRDAFLKEYAKKTPYSDKHLRRLLNKYKEDGEVGLIPGYGKNKGKTIIGTRLRRLIDPLIAPGRPSKDIAGEFRTACLAAGETPPCKATIQKYIRKVRPDNILVKYPSPIGHLDNKYLLTSDYITQSGAHLKSGIPEFDRVLGNGFFIPSSIFLAGDPGVGKSTLMAQVALSISKRQGHEHCIYFSTEQTREQMAKRLMEIDPDPRIQVVDEQDLEKIIEIIKERKPRLCIVDSIKRVRSESFKGSIDSPHYVSHVSKILRDLANKTSTAIVMINHVNKAGDMAGLKSMEHDADVVLFIEGNPLSGYRTLRSLKNRMGDTTEVGFFRMTEKGLTALDTGELLFKRDHWARSIGVSLLSIKKGNRIFMVEIQSLLTNVAPKRPSINVTGLEKEQIIKVINILKERLKIDASNYDVTMTTTGEIEVNYPYAQLAIAASILSHAYHKDLSKMVFIGEMDLTGYVRPLYGQDKLIKVALQGGEVRSLFAPQPDNRMEYNEDSRVKYIRSIYDLRKILFLDATPYFSFRNDDRQSPYISRNESSAGAEKVTD